MPNVHRLHTTHVGSLPRPDALSRMLTRQDAGDEIDTDALAAMITEAVADVVQKQVAAGVDIVSDGEMSKMSYTNYMKHRLEGFGGVGRVLGSGPADLAANPDFAAFLKAQGEDNPLRPPACVGPLKIKDRAPLEADLVNFGLAVRRCKPIGAFMSAASPGVIANFMPNQYYLDEDTYVFELADVLRDEYEAIVNAGFALQLDAPDLAMGRHSRYKDLSLGEFRRIAGRNVEALNHALSNIQPDRLRLHLCWGNYPGPHTHDIPIGDIFDIFMSARPQYLLFEAANARHAHEHAVFAERRSDIPEDKVLVPGVIDTNSNCVEHPQLVAQRLLAFADIVGRERLMAGSDCGFATVASRPRVFPALVWQKLAAMREGADIASAKLWR